MGARPRSREYSRAIASPFQEFAARHDLDYAERVAPGSGRRFPLPRGDVSEIAGGALPGGREGIVARLRKGEPDAVAIGGFSLPLAGERRETDRSRRAREASAALAASVGGDREVVSNRGGEVPVAAEARAWLAAHPSRALVLEGGHLTLVGGPAPALDWSFATLDAFCESIAPVVADQTA